jgi:transposase-like protein
VFPATTLQTCIVHLIRYSLGFGNWKERKLMAAALRPIYTAPRADAGAAALDAFERSAWGAKFPTVVAAWRRAWTHVIPFFAFPPEVRRLIYTTNALESVHARPRRSSRRAGTFRLTRPLSSSFGWRCATSRARGSASPTTGARRSTNSRFSTRIAFRCGTHRMTTRMDAVVTADAENAPAATWKPHRTRFPTRSTRLIDCLKEEEKNDLRN